MLINAVESLSGVIYFLCLPVVVFSRSMLCRCLALMLRPVHTAASCVHGSRSIGLLHDGLLQSR